MRILAVEDEVTLLRHLANRIREALPGAEVLAFDNTGDALAALPEKEIKVAFLDIAIDNMSGVDLAKRIKAVYPDCDIVFCTGYGDYAVQAFNLGVSDYLMKPITREKIEHALSMLRRTSVNAVAEQGLYIRCFGEFEVFYQGEPVAAFTKRSKELLAYLVDKAGALCTSADICNAIFRTNSDSYFRVVKKDLNNALAGIGQDEALIRDWGKLGINRNRVACDYFAYLDGDPRAVNQYKGVYMSQYDWARKEL